MEPKRKRPECPYCGTAMRPVVMSCDHCETEIRGSFQGTQFAQLSAEDTAFLARYLLAGFSIKALAEESGMGYVAIRNRLDKIIESYRELHYREEVKCAILEKLERGELTAAEAAEAIERI